MKLEDIKNIKLWDWSRIESGVLSLSIGRTIKYEFYFTEIVLDYDSVSDCYGYLAVSEYDKIPIEVHFEKYIEKKRLTRTFFKEPQRFRDALDTVFFDFTNHNYK